MRKMQTTKWIFTLRQHDPIFGVDVDVHTEGLHTLAPGGSLPTDPWGEWPPRKWCTRGEGDSERGPGVPPLVGCKDSGSIAQKGGNARGALPSVCVDPSPKTTER